MESRTIGSIVELVRGNTYKSALLDEDGPFLLGLASIERNGGFRSDKLRTYGGPSATKHLVYPGDMYVSLKDLTQAAYLLGSIARVPDSINVGRMTQDTVKLVFKDCKFPKDYFYWVLRTPQYKEYCKGRALGTTNLSLSRDDFLSYRLPEYTQTRSRIVSLLEDIEEKTSINQKTNQTLEKMAQALFKSWFVDFDPVVDNALAEGNPIPDELAHRVEVRKKAYALPASLEGKGQPLPEHIRNLFPCELEQTGEPNVGIDGWVPKGWGFSSLSALAKFTKARTDGKGLSLDTYISTDNMLPNKGGVSKASKLPELGTVPAFKAGDILVSNIRPYFKKIWFSNFEGGRSNDVLCFEAVNNKGKEYLFNLLYQDTFFDYMMTTSKGSKMPRGDKKAIMDWAIVVPPVKLQNFFSDFVKDYYRVIPNRNRQNDELSKLRDALLPKLISGELKVNKDVTS